MWRQSQFSPERHSSAKGLAFSFCAIFSFNYNSGVWKVCKGKSCRSWQLSPKRHTKGPSGSEMVLPHNAPCKINRLAEEMEIIEFLYRHALSCVISNFLGPL